jgi:hypothetical protein
MMSGGERLSVESVGRREKDDIGMIAQLWWLMSKASAEGKQPTTRFAIH